MHVCVCDSPSVWQTVVLHHRLREVEGEDEGEDEGECEGECECEGEGEGEGEGEDDSPSYFSRPRGESRSSSSSRRRLRSLSRDLSDLAVRSLSDRFDPGPSKNTDAV